MNAVNYRTLKNNIIKSCKGIKEGGIKFRVDIDKLEELVSDCDLIPVKVGEISEPVLPINIPFLNEYFVDKRLSWFDEHKYFTVLTFVDAEGLTQEDKDLIWQIGFPQAEDPDNDKTAKMAELIATKRCYFAVVVSYRNNDPKFIGRPFYEIACRANKVVIRDPNYQYNNKDMA